MSKAKIQITLCNTCVRDNYGEGIFTATETVEQTYRQTLKDLNSRQMPEFKQHNCFNFCELYHCVRVEDQTTAYFLKKISSLEQIQAVCDWVRRAAAKGELEFPQSLKDHLIETQKVAS